MTDALGSVLMLAAEDAVPVTEYAYSPYGETQASGEGSDNSSQYTARENDGTGLYYYRTRYYDPVLKRFISEDPIGLAGGVNPYAYVENDPLNYADPDGQRAKAVAAALRQFWHELSFDGPSPGLRYGNGRVCQIRYKKKPLFRIDYQPIPGSNNKSRLHIHVPPDINRHYSIDPRSLFD